MIQITQQGEVFAATGSDKEFGCSMCNARVRKGEACFICKVGKEVDVYCEACQDTWNKDAISNYKKCNLDLIRNKEHSHIKVIRK